jgi:hypothetical protein
MLDDAKALLEAGGPLGEVARLLEAAIQRGDSGEGGYEAWLLLGETRSMDEREEDAMRAFNEGVRIARERGDAGAGMLVSLISYLVGRSHVVNESSFPLSRDRASQSATPTKHTSALRTQRSSTGSVSASRTIPSRLRRSSRRDSRDGTLSHS